MISRDERKSMPYPIVFVTNFFQCCCWLFYVEITGKVPPPLLPSFFLIFSFRQLKTSPPAGVLRLFFDNIMMQEKSHKQTMCFLKNFNSKGCRIEKVLVFFFWQPLFVTLILSKHFVIVLLFLLSEKHLYFVVKVFLSYVSGLFL